MHYELGKFAVPSSSLALSLLRESSASSESLVLSPFSLSVALAIVHDGASGVTQDELTNLLLEGSRFFVFVLFLSQGSDEVFTWKREKPTKKILQIDSQPFSRFIILGATPLEVSGYYSSIVLSIPSNDGITAIALKSANRFYVDDSVRD